MRRASTCLAVLGLAVLGLSATASAAPTITLKAKAVPIPGFPHTGNILGAGAALKAEFTISGPNTAASRRRWSGVKFYRSGRREAAPAGVRHLPAKPRSNRAGPRHARRTRQPVPKGSANGVVSFGTERVGETLTVQPFFAPGGNLEFFADGTSPVSIEFLSKGNVVNSSPPFGPTVLAEVPLVETVPGALDASAKEINVKVGAAYKKGRQDDLLHHGAEEVPEGRLPAEGGDGIRQRQQPQGTGRKRGSLVQGAVPQEVEQTTAAGGRA